MPGYRRGLLLCFAAVAFDSGLGLFDFDAAMVAMQDAAAVAKAEMDQHFESVEQQLATVDWEGLQVAAQQALEASQELASRGQVAAQQALETSQELASQGVATSQALATQAAATYREVDWEAVGAEANLAVSQVNWTEIATQASAAYALSRDMAAGAHESATALQAHLAAVNWTEVESGLALARAEAAIAAAETVRSAQASASATAATAKALTATVQSGSHLGNALDAIINPIELREAPSPTVTPTSYVAALAMLGSVVLTAVLWRARPAAVNLL